VVTKGIPKSGPWVSKLQSLTCEIVGEHDRRRNDIGAEPGDVPTPSGPRDSVLNERYNSIPEPASPLQAKQAAAADAVEMTVAAAMDDTEILALEFEYTSADSSS